LLLLLLFLENITAQLSTLSPDAAAEYQQFLARTLQYWQADQLVSHTEYINKLMYNETLLAMKQNVVIYVHCTSGCDRTGELAGAYRMRYHNQTWEQVNQENTSICSRGMGCGKLKTTLYNIL
jgi:protein tyrosine phosphatase